MGYHYICQLPTHVPPWLPPAHHMYICVGSSVSELASERHDDANERNYITTPLTTYYHLVTITFVHCMGRRMHVRMDNEYYSSYLSYYLVGGLSQCDVFQVLY